MLARWLIPRIPVVRLRPWLYVPPLSLTAWFACTWIFYAWVYLLNPVLVSLFGSGVDVEHVVGPAFEEVIELALAGGLLLFVLRIVHGRLYEGQFVPW